MSSLLKDVKRVNAISRDIVYGYIKNTQRHFGWPEDNIYYNVPAIVSHWCLLYIFYHREYFSKFTSDIHINEECDIVEAMDNDTNDRKHWVFGDVVIHTESNVIKYIWEIKIIKCRPRMYGEYVLSFGIMELGGDINDGCHQYLCDGSGRKIAKFVPNGRVKGKYMARKCVYGFTENDEIYMELDVINESLRICNSGDFEYQRWTMLFDNVYFGNDTKYTLAVHLPHKGDSLQLSNYKQVLQA